VSWKPDRYGGLRSLLRRRSVGDDVREEIEHHIAERTAANIARGMTAREAREDALRRFGDVARIMRETVAIDESTIREQKRMELLDTLRRDLTHAVRALVRAPVFAVVAIVTLGLGIGASTAVFTLLKTIVLDPLPYPTSERLVLVDHEVPGISAGAAWGLSSASYFHLRDRSCTLEELGVFWANASNLRANGETLRGTTVMVSGNLLSMLGARATVGRLIGASDDDPDAPRVAVLAYDFWQTRFGGAPDVVGRVVEIEGQPAEVVGVLERGFRLPEQEADVVVARRLNAAGPHFNWHYLVGIGRLKPGVSLAGAQSDIAQLTAELPTAYPSVYDGGFIEEAQFTTRVRELHAAVVGDLSRVLWILLGSVSLVLVIACVNVANLFVVRAESRRTEQAVRRALGAGRAHVFVQSLSESLLLVIAAGALGAWLAHAGLKVMLALAPGSLPRADEIGLTPGSLLFGFGLALAAGFIFAVIPLLRGAADYGLLRDGGRGLTASRFQLRARSVLVAGQLALSVVLLAAAGLMLRSFQEMRSVDLGVSSDNVLTLTVSLPAATYDSEEKAAGFWRRLNEDIAALPGVVNVGSTTSIPLKGGACAVMTVTPPTAATDALGCVPRMVITPGWFDAMGIPVSGRQPTWDDVDRGTGAVVVSRALAERLWPGEDAIGRGVRVPNGPDVAYYRIVGVAGDIRADDVRDPPTQLVYYPVRSIEGAPLWGPVSGMVVTIRTAGTNPSLIVPGVRQIVASIDPGAAVGDIATFESIVADSMTRTTFTTVLLGLAGIMALILSIVGLYGVVAYTVSRRRAEIGIRMALGAHAGDIARMIVLQSMRLGIVGIAAGLIGAAFTTRLLRSLLFGVEPTDPLTLTAVALTLLGISALASFLPARRAAAVEPAETLRA